MMKRASRKLFGFFLVFALILSIAQPVFSLEQTKAETAKTEQIQELLELTNSAEQSLQVLNLVIDSMRQSFPEVPNEWWERFLAKVDPAGIDSLVISIYERHFTDEEINALLEFNRTPIGQSINAKMPMVTQESFIAGQQWGQSLAEELLRELEADGYSI